MTINRKGDFLAREKRAETIKELIAYFNAERGEEIGMIAAEDLLDFLLNTCGEDIFKKGVQQSRIILRENLDNLETDLELLSK
jgi:uncharacterized protein (DUF2164 family)